MDQSRRQSLDFTLIRSGQFNANELAVLTYVWSFSEYCAPKTLGDIARAIHKSDRTVRRAIDMLVTKGILTKTYRCFKKVTLRIVDLSHQKALRGAGMIKKVVLNSRKLLNKRSHRSSMSESIRSSTTEPIQNKDPENKRSSEPFNFKFKGPEEQIRDFLKGFAMKRI